MFQQVVSWPVCSNPDKKKKNAYYFQIKSNLQFLETNIRNYFFKLVYKFVINMKFINITKLQLLQKNMKRSLVFFLGGGGGVGKFTFK